LCETKEASSMDIEIRRGERGESVSTVRRADGVTVRMRGYDRVHPIPHDLAHLALERRFALRGGVWGSLSSGVVFGSVEVVSGRPRHDWRARSQRFLDRHGDQLGISEALSGVVHHHVLRELDEARLERALRKMWGVLSPDAYPFGELGTDAATELRALAARWSTLGGADSLLERWPLPPLPIPRPGRPRRR
jgi:hypothetical protein